MHNVFSKPSLKQLAFAPYVLSLLPVGAVLMMALPAQSAYAAGAGAKVAADSRPATSVALAVAPAGPTAGAPAEVTATVTSGGVNVTTNGIVSFYDSAAATAQPSVNALLGQVPINANGKARFRYIPGVGVHQLVAVFQPTSVLLGSSSYPTTPVSFTVAGKKSYVTSSNLLATPIGNFYAVADLVTLNGQAAPNGKITLTSTASGTGTVTTKNLTIATITPGYAPAVAYSSGAVHTPGLQLTTVGDFNEDGVPDVAVSNLYDGTVGISLGNGDGTFATPVTYATAVGAYAIATGDFNGDGHQDLAVTNLIGSVSILTGDGTGVFTVKAPITVGNSPYSVTVADFNGDGAQDLAVTSFGSDNSTPGQVIVLLNNGKGQFPVAKQTLTTVGIDPIATVAADYDGNGTTDLVVLNAYDGSAGIILGNGDGTFATQVVYSTNTGSQTQGNSGSLPYSATLGDFNNDGYPDVGIATLGSSSIALLLNNGQAQGGPGTFRVQNVATDPGPIGIATINADGTGNASLAVASYSTNAVDILTNDGTGNFTLKSIPSANSTPYYGLSVADVNGDGRADVITTQFGGTGFGLQLGTQTALGTTTVSSSFAGTLQASYVPAAGGAYAPSTATITVPTSQAAAATKK